MNRVLVEVEKNTRSVTVHSMSTQQPLVGVGVMIFKDGKILMGKRKNAHGEGEYAFPGGHLEHLESFEQGVRRETMEECGIEIDQIRFQLVFNTYLFAPKHYIGVGFTAQWIHGEAQVCEPDKCESWEWYSLDALPSPLFECSRWMIEAYTDGRVYMDA